MLFLLQGALAAPRPPTREEGRARSIATFLSNLNLDGYIDLFANQGITMDLLPYVSEAQLERIGVATLGDRLRIVLNAQEVQREEEVQR